MLISGHHRDYGVSWLFSTGDIMMRRNIIRTTLFCLAMILCGLAVYAGETADAGTMPEHWVGTYTQEEIDAIERALWAANLTLEDLNFRKDYTEGYECFPIVREWLHKPMEIAPGMDGIIAGIARWREKAAGPIPEVLECLKYYPDPDEKIERVYRDFENGTGFDMREIFSLMPGADNTDKLKNALIELASANPVLPFTEDELEILREYAPMQMAWHDVFESPYDEARRDEMKALVDKAEADFLYKMMSRTNIIELVDFYLKNCPYPGDLLEIIPHDAFPSDEPLIFETEFGRIGIGTFGDDRWEGDFTVLLDPGGNDYYLNCRIGASFGTDGRRFGWFADLGGDDIYDSRDIDITMGAAVLGVAAFYDLGQGNDRYFTGNCTLGASVCGVATFYDDGGSDIYEGKAYTMGAAGFGIGVMVDASLHDAPDVPTDDETPDPINVATFDNDQYNAWTNSQAFARTLGFAVCSNERGNDNYHAGGVYLHAPLFADRYQSFSQGFAIGERGIDYAGGIAFIIDYDGNDRYLGDVYNQGVGYWYSAGLLYDGAGNDTYEMTQYGQGSGIHLAVGGLIDCSGNDSYTLHAGLGTGGSHDYASSVLHDRGGNDQYFGNTSCMGGSLTNSSVIFIDRSGNDTYAGRREGGINFGRPERGFISIGVLIDLDGNDDYLGIMDNGVLWRHTSVGVGWDVIPEPVVDETEAASVPVESEEPSVALPEIINYEGELTEEVFKELWDISCRWEVGDNRYIVPHARDKLIAFGSEILPYLSKEFDNQRSGLAIRAF
ncbi:MAG TPA: hypothetical protein ENN67_01800, partial [Firmicutes bacterium]|nr:hypothetical protein [Bacillota bacterium]